jgi:fatty-acyl-CoA synthase
MTMALGRWIRDRAVATPERVAIDFRDQPTTYEQLDARSEALAAGLLAGGLTYGDRVAVLTANRPEHVEVLFACAKAGLALVPLNPRLTTGELAYQLHDAEPLLLLSTPELHALADDAAALGEVRPHRAALSRDGLDDLSRPGHARDITVHDGDPLLIVYTSGTTGRPKGAVLTHANCFWTNLSLDRVADVTTRDVVLQVLPQFHVGGWNVQPLLAWWKGATVVLEPGFEPGRALELIARKRVTTMMGVPATYLFMAEEPGFADANLTSLERAVVGGAPISERLLATYHARGVELVQGYGLTEAAPNVLCLPAEHAVRKRSSAGRPYPYVDVALRDVETGAFLDGEARGELVVRGPNVFAGYWRNHEATAEALRDGWLHTGDVAERDKEGFYRIVDRTKDMYVSGGENVYPAEVEAAIADHPAVVEVAVIGVPDPRWGEAGLAAVVARHDVDPDELRRHCRSRIAGYKVPTHVRVVDALPRSPVGKVLKTELRARFAEERG